MRAWTAALLAAAAGAWYAPALGTPWLTRDSVDVVLSHASLAGGAASLPDWLTPRYFSLVGEGGYRPLTSVVYLLLRSLFGPSLPAFRAAKLLLHAANAASAAALARRLSGQRRLAAASGAFYFASLAGPALLGLSFLPDILSSFFALAALRLHVRERGSWGAGAATAALFLAAALSKETAFVLPAVLLAYDFLCASDESRRLPALLRRHAPAWLAAAAYLLFLLFGVRAESFYGPAAWPAAAPGAAALALARYAALFYGALGGLALVVSAAAAALRRPDWRPVLFLCVWAALALAPVAGLAPFPRFASYLEAVEPRHLAFAGVALACLPACLSVAPSPILARALPCALLAAGALAAARREAPPRERWRDSVVSQLAGRGEILPADLLLSLPLIRARDPRLFERLAPPLERRAGAARSRLLLSRLSDPRLFEDPWRARRALRLAAALSELGLGRRVEAEADLEDGMRLLRTGRAGEAAPRLGASFTADRTLFPACFAAAEALRRAGRAEESFARASLCVEAWETAVAVRDDVSPGRPWDPTMIREPDEWTRSRERLERADKLLAARRYGEARQAYVETAAAVSFLWPERWQAARQAALLDSGAREAFDAGLDAYATGDAAAARAALLRAVRASPSFSEALLSRGALSAAQGRWDRALRDYRAAERQPFGARLRETIASARATALARRGGSSSEAAR